MERSSSSYHQKGSLTELPVRRLSDPSISPFKDSISGGSPRKLRSSPLRAHGGSPRRLRRSSEHSLSKGKSDPGSKKTKFIHWDNFEIPYHLWDLNYERQFLDLHKFCAWCAKHMGDTEVIRCACWTYKFCDSTCSRRFRRFHKCQRSEPPT